MSKWQTTRNIKLSEYQTSQNDCQNDKVLKLLIKNGRKFTLIGKHVKMTELLVKVAEILKCLQKRQECQNDRHLNCQNGRPFQNVCQIKSRHHKIRVKLEGISKRISKWQTSQNDCQSDTHLRIAEITK